MPQVPRRGKLLGAHSAGSPGEAEIDKEGCFSAVGAGHGGDYNWNEAGYPS